MLDHIKEKIENLEILASNFITTKKGPAFIKDKITDLIKTGINLPLQFGYLIVAISKNGGLIATCKQMNYYDQHKTRINNNLLIMHQNAGKRYYIPLDWEYTKSYIVSLEFNDKEQLYGFCNNGDIRKMDILTNTAILKVNSFVFTEEGIIKAKLCEKGFIALTGKGNLYYASDIKDPKPNFIISISEQLKFSNDVEFMGIPPSTSASGKIEVLILNETGEGVLHVVGTTEESSNIKGEKNKQVKYDIIIPEELGNNEENDKQNQKNIFDLENNDNENDEINNNKKCKINAMCISPNQENIAFYCATNSTIYIYPSSLRKGDMEKYTLKMDKIQLDSSDAELTKDEMAEHQSLFSYDDKSYQFLFCGSSGVALCSKRFIVLVTKNDEIISFRISEESSIKSLTGGPLFKCISEVDGIRIYSKDGIYLISEVPKELIDVCDPFSKHPSKSLLNAYGFYLSKNADCDKIIRDIAMDLPNSITTLQMAAINLFFTEDNEDTSNIKESQMLLIKAAQYGKSFVQKGDFNYEKYVDKCRDLRIINSLRNLKNTPRFLTYAEYNDMNPDSPSEFMKLIMRYHDYRFAFELNSYLGYENEKIYQQFCSANIRRLSDDINADKIFEALNEKLLECQNISYITLAKKCIKHKKFKLAEKFLEQEKSIVVKVPQYLQLKNWDKALDLAIESNDRTVIKVVIDKIYKVEEKGKFIRIVGKKQKAHRAVIEYLRMHDKNEELKDYLINKKDYEELLFIALEYFFKSKTLKDRKKFIKEANEYVKEMKGMPNFEFYKNYLKDLEASLTFKKKCIANDFIKPNDISAFDNSIFDCYKLGINDDKNFKLIEEGNKQFNIGQKKITYLKFKKWAESKEIINLEKIDNEVAKIGYKKLDVTPLIVAKILFNANKYDKAVKYINEINDINDFEEKIQLLKKMDKHKEAIDIIMKERKIEKEEYLNGILREKPELKSFIDNYGKK